MAEDRELELKLEVETATVASLLSHPLLQKDAPPKRTVSVYFDTAKGHLQAAGMTLRVREAGGAYLQTIKASAGAAAGLFDRDEWEGPVEGPEPDLRLAKNTPLAALLGARAKQLRPVFETRVDRRTWQISFAKARIEAILDEGEVRAGKRSEPLVELELELKSGPRAALFALARELQAAAPLRLGVLAKSERGDRLARRRSSRVAKAEPVLLERSMNAAEAFKAVAFACLRHFRLNQALAAGPRDPDGLHQCRVALRRLRSALSMFRPLVADEHLARFRAAFRDAAATLGEARDLDVFLKKQGARVDKSALGKLKVERERAYDRAAAMLDGREFQRLMLDFVEWVDGGPWTRASTPLPLLREEPALDIAAAILDRFWKRVKRGGRVLAELSEEHRHEVRIEAKKLRYASEFFSALYASPRRAARRDEFLAALEKLQDDLGDLNDVATGRELAARLSQQAGIDISHSIAAGTQDTRPVVASAGRAVDVLIAVKPFWR